MYSRLFVFETQLELQISETLAPMARVESDGAAVNVGAGSFSFSEIQNKLSLIISTTTTSFLPFLEHMFYKCFPTISNTSR